MLITISNLLLLAQVSIALSLGIGKLTPPSFSNISSALPSIAVPDPVSELSKDVLSLTEKINIKESIQDVLNYNASMENLPESALWVTPDGKVITMYFQCNSTCKEEFTYVTDYDKHISFHLVTSRNFQETYRIRPNSTENLDKFIPGAEVKIICHGFWSSYMSGIGPQLREAYRFANNGTGKKLNLILVDWSPLAATFWYPWAVSYTHSVAEYSARLVAYLVGQTLVTLDKVHFIGHSLGAHTGGLFGQIMQLNNYSMPARITGLDPAGPFYSRAEKDKRLSPDDAELVDAIHTDGWLGLFGFGWGLMKPVGDIDYYPNGGTGRQPACSFLSISCSHSIAYSYFAESIRNPFSFYGCRCDRKEWKAGKCGCRQRDRVVMGEEVPLQRPSSVNASMGVVHLKTRNQESYGCGRNLNCDMKCSSDPCSVKSTAIPTDEMKNGNYTSEKSTVSIFVPTFGSKGLSWEHICTGTLISVNLVLTSSECLAVGEERLQQTLILAGAGNQISTIPEKVGQVQLAQESWSFEHSQNSKDPSLLILETREPFQETSYLRVARFPKIWVESQSRHPILLHQLGDVKNESKAGEPYYSTNGTLLGVIMGHKRDTNELTLWNILHKPHWQWIQSSLNYCRQSLLGGEESTMDTIDSGIRELENKTLSAFNSSSATLSNIGNGMVQFPASLKNATSK